MIVPLARKPVVEKKAVVYVEVVKNLNKARETMLPFIVTMYLVTIDVEFYNDIVF